MRHSFAMMPVGTHGGPVGFPVVLVAYCGCGDWWDTINLSPSNGMTVEDVDAAQRMWRAHRDAAAEI